MTVERPMRATTAVGYSRVSTEEQAREGVSLAAQEEKLRAYCALQNLELVQIYRDEGVSAGKPLDTRPAGGTLLRELRTHGARHVVALKLDRLFRDAVDCLNTTQTWDSAGIALHLIDLGGQSLNTGSAMGRFFITIMAGAAELERNLVRERTSIALQHKKARGDKLGAPPLGFVATAETGVLAVDPTGLEAVRVIMFMKTSSNASYRTICRELTRRGLTPKRGTKWHAESVRKIWEARTRYGSLLFDGDAT